MESLCVKTQRVRIKKMRTGLLSDKRIRENYLDAYKPVAVGKLHSVMQRPATSFFAPTRPRRDYNAPPPLIPQYVAEQASKKAGADRSRQIAAVNGDFLRRASGASTSYAILRPPERRQGALQQDIGKTPLRSMGAAVASSSADVEDDYIERLVSKQTAYGPGFTGATPGARLALDSKRGRENLAPAAQALQGEVAEYLDPMLASEMTMIAMMTHKSNNPMVLKRVMKQTPVVGDVPEQPVQSLLPPEEPPEDTNDKTLGGEPLTQFKTEDGTSTIQYVSDPSAVNQSNIPRKGNKAKMAKFLANNLKLQGLTPAQSEAALKGFRRIDMLNLITKYFPRVK